MELNELLLKQKKLNVEIDGTSDGVSNEDLVSIDLIQLVSFVLDDVEYGVDILSVHEILRMPAMTRLPNTPDYIKGVINLRGNVIPVVDARMRFGFPVAEPTDLTRIIVIEADEKEVGLLVDNVYQVVRISQSDVDPPSSLIDGISEEFISGIGRLNDRLIILLNMANLLDDNRDIE